MAGNLNFFFPRRFPNSGFKDASNMVSGAPVSTITGISCPLFKWSITRIWSPRPAPLFNDVSAGSGGRIESSASQFGGVAQEHNSTRQTHGPTTLVRDASKAGVTFTELRLGV